MYPCRVAASQTYKRGSAKKRTGGTVANGPLPLSAHPTRPEISPTPRNAMCAVDVPLPCCGLPDLQSWIGEDNDRCHCGDGPLSPIPSPRRRRHTEVMADLARDDDRPSWARRIRNE